MLVGVVTRVRRGKKGLTDGSLSFPVCILRLMGEVGVRLTAWLSRGKVGEEVEVMTYEQLHQISPTVGVGPIHPLCRRHCSCGE